MASRSPAGDRTAALNRALRGMFKALQNRPLPSRLWSVIDQLADAPEQPLKKRS